MKSNNNALGCLYDLVGLLIFSLILFGGVMCCSPKARNAVVDAYEYLTEEDSIVSDSIKNDSIIIKTDTITIKEVDTTIRDTISLVKGNDNLFYINTEVNGIPMKFAIDTGCSHIAISIIEYMFLEKQGLITDKTKTLAESIIANGDTIQEFSIKIDKIKIGNKVINNVTCLVSDNPKSPMLLGQGVLSQMGDIRLKYNEQILIIE